MYGILNEKMALRSWSDMPCAFYTRDAKTATELQFDTLFRLLLADGVHEMPEDSLQQKLLEGQFLFPCKKGERQLTDWQRYRAYDNVYMPAINLEITARCNYNCRHCFNATGSKALKAEMSLERAEAILDQARACGVNTFLLTGGEPMMHPDFLSIMDAIYQRDMSVFEINTNGAFITDQILDHFSRFRSKPMFKISFDGLFYHDWMRGAKGAQVRTLEAIRKVVCHGFQVMVQYNINRKNLDTVGQTLDLLDQIGVLETRLIRTSEAPRWKETSLDQTIEVEDFFDISLQILEEYAAAEHRMNIEVWQFLELRPVEKTISFGPVIKTLDGILKKNTFACKLARSMMAISADGNVYPCMQSSGAFTAKGYKLGNVYDTGIQELLSGSRYLDLICTKARYVTESNLRCRNCRYQGYCGGGCPILSLVAGDQTWEGYDPLRCFFYQNRYDLVTQKVLSSYRNITPIEVKI